ncbi:MAG: LytR C-terminal domain-containing protein [bacterium]|nr:LytR C-terminal domain-containing protein [bacterium]
MFLTQPKVVLFITPNSLKVYNTHQGKLSEIEFPQNTVKFLEIRDQQSLEKIITDAVHELKTPSKSALLVLSEDMYFRKDIPLTSENKDTELATFYDSVPIEEKDIVQKEILLPNKVVALAIDPRLFQQVQSLFEKEGWKIYGVYPAAVFEIPPDQTELQDAQVISICKEYVHFKKDDLLLATQMAVAKTKEISIQEAKKVNYHPPVSKKQYAYFSLSIVLLLGSFAFALYQQGWFSPKVARRPPTRIISTVTQDVTQIATAAAESTASAKPKDPEFKSQEALQILIENGAGVQGLAADLKEALSDQGYANIEASTAAELNKDNTRVGLTVGVSGEDKEIITKELEKIPTAVDFYDIPEGEQYDIKILIGQK